MKSLLKYTLPALLTIFALNLNANPVNVTSASSNVTKTDNSKSSYCDYNSFADAYLGTALGIPLVVAAIGIVTGYCTEVKKDICGDLDQCVNVAAALGVGLLVS